MLPHILKITLVGLFCINNIYAQPTISVGLPTVMAGGGEFESTTIPPNVNSHCAKGRVLIANDGRYSLLNSGINNPSDINPSAVYGRDIGTSNVTTIQSSFDSLPDPSNQSIGGNDAGLVSLPNGTAFFFGPAISKAVTASKVGWEDQTFRDSYGPSTRSWVPIWRSDDCGKSFKFTSQIDPADVAFRKGICAYPQFRWNDEGTRIETAPWDMGGTDGARPAVSGLDDDTLYLVHQCVGFHPKQGVTPFTPDPNSPVNKTLIFRSTDQGKTWDAPFEMNARVWRGHLVMPLNSHTVAVNLDNRIVMGETTQAKTSDNAIVLGNYVDFPAPVGYGGGFELSKSDREKCTTEICKVFNAEMIYANIWVHTVMAPLGSDHMVLAYPSIITSGTVKKNGIAVYTFAPNGVQTELDPILPISGNFDSSFIGWLTVVPSNAGGVLFYWYDVNAKTKRAQIRGRFVSHKGGRSQDFNISSHRSSIGKQITIPSWSFNTPQKNIWYGDYHSAGGFATIIKPKIPVAPTRVRYQFYPTWVEHDRKSRIAEVIVMDTFSSKTPEVHVVPRVLPTGKPVPQRTAKIEDIMMLPEAVRVSREVKIYEEKEKVSESEKLKRRKLKSMQ